MGTSSILIARSAAGQPRCFGVSRPGASGGSGCGITRLHSSISGCPGGSTFFLDFRDPEAYNAEIIHGLLGPI